jgi:hypothetical protein
VSEKPNYSKLIASSPSNNPYDRSLPRAKPAAPAPAPAAPRSGNRSFHVWIDGHTYGPISQEELNSWFLQRRITATTQVMLLGTQDWQPAGNFLLSTGRPAHTAASNPYADGGGYTNSPYQNQSLPAVESIANLIMVSGILNLIFGILWCLTCYGVIFGVPLIILACFELNFQSSARYQFPFTVRSNAQCLGIFEVVCGLFNWFSLVLGIITLCQLSSLRD